MIGIFIGLSQEKGDSTMKLNCDLGESFGSWTMGRDNDIMPLIDMANIACGFHASDPLIMQKTVALAVANDVSIGAHPGYPDLVGFGRRSMQCSAQEIEAFVIYQCGALEAMCAVHGVHVDYVKPHGALYNDMMRDDTVFMAIVSALHVYNKNLKLMILSTKNNAHYEELVKPYGLEVIYEVFADRAYTEEGLLVPRSQSGAVIESHADVVARIELLQTKGKLLTLSGKEIDMRADSMCVHGDNKEAIELVKALRGYLG